MISDKLKGLVKKELREHAWLGLAAMTVMCLGYTRSLWDLNQGPATYPFARWSFSAVATFGGAGFMSALGFLQTFKETRGGAWAFLVHRPVNYQQIFLAKTLAAFALFVAAIVVPTIGAIVWSALPGVLASPFQVTLTKIPAADLLAACPYYFAGFTVGRWEPRFKALRVAPLTLPLLHSFAIRELLPSFWMVMATSTFTILLMGYIARGFLEPQGDEDAAAWRMTPLAALTATALQLVLVVASPFKLQMLDWPTPSSMASRSHETKTRTFVSRDGDVLVAKLKDVAVQSILTHDGKPSKVRAEHEGDLDSLQVESHSLSLSASSSGAMHTGNGRARYRRPRRIRRLVAQWHDRKQPIEWYFDRLAGWFIGYDRKTKRRVGFLGPEGMTKEGVSRFSERRIARNDILHPVVVFESMAYRVDWKQGTIAPIELSTKDNITAHFFRPDGGSYELLRTSSTIEVLAPAGTVTSLSLPPSQQGCQSLNFGALTMSDRYVVSGRCNGSTFAFFSRKGELLNLISVPSIQRSAYAPVKPSWGLAPMVALPLSFNIAGIVGLVGGYPEGDRRPTLSSKHLSVLLAVATFPALLAWILGRRQERKLRAWMALWAFLGSPIAALIPLLLGAPRVDESEHDNETDEPLLLDERLLPPQRT